MAAIRDLIDELEGIPVRAVYRSRMERVIRELGALEAAKEFPECEIDVPYGLTKTEARIFSRLLLAMSHGNGVSKDALLHSLYFDKPECDQPEIKIVDVFICKLRKKLIGSKYSVETLWGRGFALKRSDV